MKVTPVPSVDIPENRPRFNYLFHWVCSKCGLPVTYREHYDDWVHTATSTADCDVKPTIQQLLDGDL